MLILKFKNLEQYYKDGLIDNNKVFCNVCDILSMDEKFKLNKVDVNFIKNFIKKCVKKPKQYLPLLLGDVIQINKNQVKCLSELELSGITEYVLTEAYVLELACERYVSNNEI